MSFTTNFNLETPQRGTYIDTWDIPLNANFVSIDNILNSLSSCNKSYSVPNGKAIGTLWFDLNGVLGAGNGGILKFKKRDTGPAVSSDYVRLIDEETIGDIVGGQYITRNPLVPQIVSGLTLGATQHQYNGQIDLYSFTAYWAADNSAAFSHYIVQLINTDDSTVREYTTKSLSYTFDNLLNMSSWNVRVMAVDNQGQCSPWSAAQPRDINSADAIAPITTTNVALTAGLSNILVKWDQNVTDKDIAGYEVHAKTVTGEPSINDYTNLKANVAANSALITVLPNTTYYVYVRAYDRTGNRSAFSIVRSATTSSTLSSVGGNTGFIELGSVVMLGNSYLSCGRTAWNIGSGFWLGKDSGDGVAKLGIGDSNGNQFTWDGSEINIKGNIVLGNGNHISSGQTGFNIGKGFWIGKSTVTGNVQFSLGDPAGNSITYDEGTGDLNVQGILTIAPGTIDYNTLANKPLNTVGSLTSKNNYVSFSDEQNGQAYICGYDSLGRIADVDGYVEYGTDSDSLAIQVTIPRGTVFTEVQGQTGYILVDLSFSDRFTVSSTQVNMVFVQKVSGNTWQYDNNSSSGNSWVTFGIGASDILIGKIKTSAAQKNLIDQCEVWSYGVLPDTTAGAGSYIGNIFGSGVPPTKVLSSPPINSTGLYFNDRMFGFIQNGTWKNYFDNQGKFYISGDGVNNYIDWNVTKTNTLTIRGELNANDIKAGKMVVDFLDAGTITSKVFNLAVIPGQGNVAFKVGKSTFGDNTNGFILGIDDADAQKSKFELGNASNYVKWNGSSLTIRGTLNADDIKSGTITATMVSGGEFDASKMTVKNLKVNWLDVIGDKPLETQGCLNFDPSCSNTDVWDNNLIEYGISGGITGLTALYSTTGDLAVERRRFKYDATRRYRVSVLARKQNGANGTLRFGFALYSSVGVPLIGTDGETFKSINVATELTTTFQEFIFDISPGVQPTGTVNLAALVYLGLSNNSGLKVEVQNVRIIDNTESWNAQDKADKAATDAIAANTLLGYITDDNMLTGGEKLLLKKEWDQIAPEKSLISTQANSFGISYTLFANAHDALNSYLNTSLLTNMVTSVAVSGAELRSKFANYYTQRTDLLNSIATETSRRSTYSGTTGRPKQYRVVSTGTSSTGQPITAGFYDGETNTRLYVPARSYCLTKIRRSDGVITLNQNYDVYGGQAGLLAAELNATLSDTIIVISTYNEAQANRLTLSLPEAMYRCGASPAVFGSVNVFKQAGAYLLIGIGGCGQGNGFEAYAGSVDNSTSAWVDVVFQVLNGNMIISGQNYTNSSVKDLDFTGMLDADKTLTAINNTITTTGGGITLGADSFIQTAGKASNQNIKGLLFGKNLAGNPIVNIGEGVHGDTTKKHISWNNDELEIVGNVKASVVSGSVVNGGTINGTHYFLGDGTTYGSIETYNFDGKDTGIRIQDGAVPYIQVKGGYVEAASIKSGVTNIIDTPKIVPDSVNIPVYGGQGQLSVPITHVNTTVAQATITQPYDTPVFITAVVDTTSSQVSSVILAGMVSIYRRTNSVDTLLREVPMYVFVVLPWFSIFDKTTILFKDTPGIGSHTYYLQARAYQHLAPSLDVPGSVCKNGAITLQGIQR